LIDLFIYLLMLRLSRTMARASYLPRFAVLVVGRTSSTALEK